MGGDMDQQPSTKLYPIPKYMVEDTLFSRRNHGFYENRNLKMDPFLKIETKTFFCSVPKPEPEMRSYGSIPNPKHKKIETATCGTLAESVNSY